MLLVKEKDGGLVATEYTLASSYWQKQYIDRGIKYLLWVEYNASVLSWNLFRGYIEDRCLRINKELDVNYILEEEEESIRRYKDLERGHSMLISSYESIIETRSKLEQFIRKDMELNKETKNGGVVYKPKDVTGALLELEKLGDMIIRISKKIESEFDENKGRLERGDLNEFTD